MKKLRSLFRAKRGFSPVIASLTLMLLAVASGFILYGYVMGWLGGVPQVPTTVKGQLQFDSLANNSTHILVYIRNVGGKTLDLTNGAVYLNGVKESHLSGLLEIGAVTDVGFTYVCTTKSWYVVTVVYKDGTAVAQSFQAM